MQFRIVLIGFICSGRMEHDLPDLENWKANGALNINCTISKEEIESVYLFMDVEEPYNGAEVLFCFYRISCKSKRQNYYSLRYSRESEYKDSTIIKYYDWFRNGKKICYKSIEI